MIKAYLAGLDVFLPDPKEMGEKKKRLCDKYGFTGVFPIDAELNLAGLSPFEAGLLISEANEKLLKNCQFVIANITPFRGPSADVGTVFEIGFAKALGLPIFAYTNTEILFTERTVRHLGIDKDKSIDKLIDHDNMEIEQFSMTDNLMIDGGIITSKGEIISVTVPQEEMYTSLLGFEKCLERAHKFFFK